MLLSAIQPIKNKFKSLRTSGYRLEASSNCCLTTTLTKVNKVLETRRKENQQIPYYFFVQNIILNFLSPLKIFFILSVINDHCGDRLELLFSIIFSRFLFLRSNFDFFSLEFGAFECLFIDVARTCVFRPRGRFNKLFRHKKGNSHFIFFSTRSNGWFNQQRAVIKEMNNRSCTVHSDNFCYFGAVLSFDWWKQSA